MRRFWWLDTEETSVRAQGSIVAAVLAGHALLFYAMGHLAPSPPGGGTASEPSVRVHVAQKRNPSSAPHVNKLPQKVAKAPLKSSATAPRIPRRLIDSSEPVRSFDPPQPLPHPEEPAAPSTPSPDVGSDVLGGGNVSSRLATLLPQGSGRYLEDQRNVGAENSSKKEEREEFIPRPEMPTKVERPQVVTTEFSTLAYRLELEQRFANAWGEVRTLPQGSRFNGIPGEIIAFNIIVNRDGTLRRIVNISALEQTGRDFRDVDGLVHEFAGSVFPMNPLPARIRDDPFIIRWTLRFVGNRWGFF